MATLSRRYHVAIPGPSDEFRADLAAVRAGIDGKIEEPATLFKAAIAFEKRAVAFFSDRARTVPEGSVEHELYRELAAEEVEHVAILETEWARWSAGREACSSLIWNGKSAGGVALSQAGVAGRSRGATHMGDPEGIYGIVSTHGSRRPAASP